MPINIASISLIVCFGLESCNSSGITDTVAMYINPPAVNGRIQETADSPMFSASNPSIHPAIAPTQT